MARCGARFRRGVWRNPDYGRLWLASTVSTFGTDITGTAFPFVAILELDATPWQIGLLGIARMTPAFAFGMVAGAWVDRLPRRPLMIACDWIRAATLLSIPLAAVLGALTFPHLLIVAALVSVATTFFDVADRSMLPSVVEREELVDANRGLTAGKTVAEASGFAVSGWLVQLLSAPGAIVVDTATYVWSALTLRRIRRPERRAVDGEEREALPREILAGLRFLRTNPILVAIGLSVFVMSCAIQTIGAVYLLYVNRELGFAPGVLGVIFATGGLFSLVASVGAGRILAFAGVGPLLIASTLLVAFGQSLTTLATGVTAFAVVAMLLQQAMDLPWTLYEIAQVSTRQAVTPDEWQGRMNGSFHALEFGGYLIGALLGGWLGSTVGLRETILVGAIGIALAGLPILFSPLRAMRTVPEAPAP